MSKWQNTMRNTKKLLVGFRNLYTSFYYSVEDFHWGSSCLGEYKSPRGTYFVLCLSHRNRHPAAQPLCDKFFIIPLLSPGQQKTSLRLKSIGACYLSWHIMNVCNSLKKDKNTELRHKQGSCRMLLNKVFLPGAPSLLREWVKVMEKHALVIRGCCFSLTCLVWGVMLTKESYHLHLVVSAPEERLHSPISIQASTFNLYVNLTTLHFLIKITQRSNSTRGYLLFLVLIAHLYPRTDKNQSNICHLWTTFQIV